MGRLKAIISKEIIHILRDRRTLFMIAVLPLLLYPLLGMSFFQVTQFMRELAAVATPYRERSHFDGQDVLESGYATPGFKDSGWLNRALESLPRGERVATGLAVGPTTPLILRGAAPTVPSGGFENRFGAWR